MSPTYDLAFFGYPTIETMAMDIDAVHISVTFSWDMEKAEDLYEQWQILGVPVEVGGPAFDDRMGDFTPGMYVKPGMVFTSRGCSKDCWFCSVPRCSRGVIRELTIHDGWPRYRRLYLQAFDKMLENRYRLGKMEGYMRMGITPKDVFNWWMDNGILPGQVDLFEEEDYE
jgi:hypothetical protein